MREEPLHVHLPVGDELGALGLALLRERPRPHQRYLPAQEIRADVERLVRALADHGQKRELGVVTITRGDLTSSVHYRRRVLIKSRLVTDKSRRSVAQNRFATVSANSILTHRSRKPLSNHLVGEREQREREDDVLACARTRRVK